jgi:hypothetical protein
MIISSVVSASDSIGSRFSIPLLAWVVVVSLSCADLSDTNEIMNSPSANLQQATETDLDEIRNDVGIVRILEPHAIDFVRIDFSFAGSIPLALPPTGISRSGLLSKLSVYRL